MSNMADSRTKNTKRNITSGLIYKIIGIILPFINRTAILWILGAEFTGLSSLFSSILQVLNIAELGFNSAIVYSLYEPMANKDHPKIIELVSLYRKIYNVVGTVILVGGLLIMPFLKLIIHGSYPESINLYVIYFLYLMNSVVSYFLFAYKEVLLIADQRQDVSNKIRSISSIFRYISELVVLYITKNFYLYLIMAIVGTIMSNILIQLATCKRYPYFKLFKGTVPFPKEIKTQVQGLLIDRLGDTCRNSFDNIIITAFIGLTATAIYGNYYYIYLSLYSIMLVVCNAMSASVGNSIVKESSNKNYNNLIIFTYIFSWISGWATVCLFCLYQPFMTLWAGEELLLSIGNMSLFCIYFYAINMTNIRNQYISGTGIWWQLKVPCIVEAVSNLALNIILGRLLGITGVILATIITIFFFNFCWRTHILFKLYFKQKFITYLIQYVYYFLLTVIATICTYYICNMFSNSGIQQLIIRGIICIFIPNIIFFIGYRPLKQFDSASQLIKRVIKER